MSRLSARGAVRRAAAAPRCAAALMAGALLVPVLAGCSGSAGPGTAALRSVATADRAALAEGGTLTWGVDALPATLNAFQYDADAVTDRIAQAVLPALFTLDERGRPTLNPDFLVSAEITAREPRQIVRYALHPSARWSDGEPITAADFIAQWKALGGQDNAYWTARNVGYDRIENVEAGQDEREVLVTFAKPYADWQSLFTPLYPRSVTGDPDAFNDASRDRLPAGAGPFVVKAMDRDAGRIALVRNEEWWGDPALLDALVFAESDRTERLAAMARGELDVAEVDPADADRIAGASGDDLVAGAPGVAGAPPAVASRPAAPETAGPSSDAASGAASEAAGEEGAGEEGSGEEGSAGAGGPAAAPAAAPALLGLAEAHRAAAGPAASRKERAAAERAAARYAQAVAAEEEARQRAFAARERRTAERLAGYTVYRAYAAAYTQLALNGTSEALSDERVRWALARGLDRRALAAEAHGPARLPVRPVGSHLWVLGQEGYRDNSAALGEVGTEYAAALLDEAGWHGGPADAPGRTDAGGGEDGADAGDAKAGAVAAPAAVPLRLGAALPAARQRAALLRQTATLAGQLEREGGRLSESAHRTRLAADRAEDQAEELARQVAAGVRTKEGTPLVLRFVLPDGPGAAQLRAVAERITAMLAEVGVGAVIEEVDGERYFNRYIAEGDFDLALYSWPATAYPATDARPLFAKPQSIPGGELFIEQNYTRVGTDHIDQLLSRAAAELDAGRRAELLNKADARIWAAAGSIPLYQAPQLVAARKDLAGVGAFGLQTPRYQDIGFRG